MARARVDEHRLTIADVAKRAGVSTMTVSNVINGTGRVGAAARGRVTAAIATLGYVPNQSARRLSGSAIACVGLIYGGVESIFIDAMLASIAVTAAESGIQLLVRAPDEPTSDGTAAVARELVRQGAQGLLLIPPYAELLSVTPELAGNGMPLAAIATEVAIPGVNTIRIDNRGAARAMTERLIAKGRKRIAILAGPQHHSDGVARLEGVRDALRAHGLLVDARMEAYGDFTFASGREAARLLLDLRPLPDAIVAGNDDMAAAALWLAHQRGIRLPDDLAITGFDDTLIATRVWPPLTTVHQPIGDMASRAIESLTRAIRTANHRGGAQDVVLPHAIVERLSA